VRVLNLLEVFGYGIASVFIVKLVSFIIKINHTHHLCNHNVSGVEFVGVVVDFTEMYLYWKERRQLKLFSPNSDPPYPSRWTHPSYVFGSG
jgi:hypothetical protein